MVTISPVASQSFRSPQKAPSFSESLVGMFLPYEAGAIPSAAVAAALRCIQDTVGVAIAAAASGTATAGAVIAPPAGTDGGAVIWGLGSRSTPEGAALANGMLAHGLDFDDTHPAAIMHASAVNVPVALALGQTLRTPPAELLAALVLSYEVSARLGRLAPGPFQDRGFQSTSVLGAFAAAFLTARLMRVPAEVAVQAMGIVGSLASGLMEYLADGSDVKQLHPGWAAQSGIQAVRLAAAGLTGPRTVLEGRFGVYKAYAGLEIDFQSVLSPPDGAFEVELMAPKPYPACLCVHPVVQAALDLRALGVLIPERLEAVRDIHCEVPAWYVNLVFEPLAEKSRPVTAYDGRFSAPFCLARAAIDGELTVRSFGRSELADPLMRSLAAKVSYSAHAFDEFPKSFPARVRVTFEDGETHESLIRHNLGSAGAPFSAADAQHKFRSNTDFAVGPEAAQALYEAIEALPYQPDAGRLWTALRGAQTKRVR